MVPLQSDIRKSRKDRHQWVGLRSVQIGGSQADREWQSEAYRAGINRIIVKATEIFLDIARSAGGVPFSNTI